MSFREGPTREGPTREELLLQSAELQKDMAEDQKSQEIIAKLILEVEMNIENDRAKPGGVPKAKDEHRLAKLNKRFEAGYDDLQHRVEQLANIVATALASQRDAPRMRA